MSAPNDLLDVSDEAMLCRPPRAAITSRSRGELVQLGVAADALALAECVEHEAREAPTLEQPVPARRRHNDVTHDDVRSDVWPRRDQRAEPVIEPYDIDTLFRVLFDIRRALESIERLLEDDDGREEAEEAPEEP